MDVISVSIAVFILLSVVNVILLLKINYLKKLYIDKSLIIDKISDNILKLSAEFNSSAQNQERYSSLVMNNVTQQMNTFSSHQQKQLEGLHKQLFEISQLNENKIENIRQTLNVSLTRLHDENNTKLEQIRMTVEEKLQNTLEQRLGASFKFVSERLETLHKSLGEMQTLASGVGDLKKILSNVKTRGVWGEAQIEVILQQIMVPGQYEKNVAVRKGSQDRVEYAIKLPGVQDEQHVWLPIDAKFPLEDYQRLIEAQEHSDIQKIDQCSKALELNIRKSAKTISEKYIHPPFTTDFAIMFLPIEGLYAEAIRKPGMIESIQSEYRIILTSPTTLCAILSSLQMGFKTVAIQKHSSNIWRLLESIKPEFVKFADLLSKTKTKLEQATQAIGDAENRTRHIQRKLNTAENQSIAPTASHIELLE